MTSEVQVMRLLVGSELVGDSRVWSAHVAEIRLFAVGDSREEVIALAQESVAIEYPDCPPELEIEDE